MKSIKRVTLNLGYRKSKSDKANGIFYGGVDEPKHIDELTFDIADDYDFNIETEEFTKNGLFSVDISGSDRALMELGKFLINMAMFKTDDDNYHEHIDGVCNSDGKASVNITVRKK